MFFWIGLITGLLCGGTIGGLVAAAVAMGKIDELEQRQANIHETAH